MISVNDTSVTFILPMLVTVIVKLTRPKTSTDLTSTSLITVKFTGATSTVALSEITVLFSLQDTVTVLSQIPVALDLATISNS